MNLLLYWGLILALLFLFFQDLKHRAIHITLPLLIIIIGFSIPPFPFYLRMKSTLINCVFFLLIFGMMVFYMRIKNKNYSNPLNTYFGLGDVLFFISIAPLFELQKFLVFIVSTMLFSITLYFIFLKKRQTESIPLAGFSALLLVFVLCLKLFFKPYSLLLF
ncbi:MULTISPECIES: prepilin peptidase [Flavobacterium]|uniref:prepilin peptidase n=1 Tax=Flavobacterium TaxID=237 RepID=UPI000745CCD9|nr:hypothetical protein AWN65_13020 [Flavobacterium covae]OXA81803.1 hypothetical protein B0A56_05585 [Flavobacterium columnare NBRC 100251 = ATCC 23463]POR23797.1 hypothetical protein BWK57_00365 [Flavobacterium columnare]AND64142.1 hypothetical protein AX766_06810 [Flavobacterium covae]OWP82141.1 hypothetical protein BWK63_02445 [Flavobacterium covae]